MALTFRFGWSLAVLGLLIAVIAVVDVLACEQFSLWIVYMVPVLLGSWLRGARFGALLAVTASVVLALDGFLVGHPFVSDALFVYAIVSRTLSYLLVAWLCSRLRRMQELEHQVQAYEELCDSLHIGLDSKSR